MQAVLVSVLAVGSWQEWINIHGIFACAFFLGATRAFESPAQQALLPSLINSSHLPRALALNSSLREASVIIGPAMGGLLYALHPEIVYWWGVVPAVVIGRLGTLMIVGLWMKFFPELTRRQELTKTAH